MTHPDDTATIERELRAVDVALSEGVAAHADPSARDLQELALTLRADAPRPEAAFAQEMRTRVEAGFARADGSRARRSAALLSPRRLPPIDLTALGGAVAALLLVVVVVFAVSSDGGGGDDAEDGGGGGVELPSAGGGAGESSGADDAAGRQSPRPAPSVASPAVPGGNGFAPNRRERKIERSIAMTLTAPDDDIPQVADDVNRVTARHGGFVLRSELDTSDDGATGSFELRIPSSRLQGALRDLAAVATVSSQSQSGQDVTREHVTAKDRLQAARAERRGLLRRLEAADTDEEAEAIRARLDLVAGEIAGLRGQLRDLRLRTDYAIVAVDLIGEEDRDSGSGGGAFDDAVGDAGDLLVGFAGVLIRVLAIALPLGSIALAAWLIGAALRRRRRESALA
jgi:Domain of unknown function (DUF4349)